MADSMLYFSQVRFSSATNYLKLIPETSDVISLLKYRQVTVAKSSQKRSAADTSRTATKQRHLGSIS